MLMVRLVCVVVECKGRDYTRFAGGLVSDVEAA